MEKVKIVKIAHFDKDKNGNPLISQKGNPYSRCLIQDAWNRKLSGFGNKITRGWKIGDEVELEITQNGQYWNWKFPPQVKKSDNWDIEDLKLRMKSLEDRVSAIEDSNLKDDIEEVFSDEPPIAEEQ